MTLDIFKEKGTPLDHPRSSMAQCLQAMLTAELTDNDGWRLLIQLADNLGHDTAEFESALANEEEHLLKRSHMAARIGVGQRSGLKFKQS